LITLNNFNTSKPSATHAWLIDIYSIRIQFSTNSEFVFNNLSKDFQLFTITDSAVIDAQVNISACLQSPLYERIPPVNAALHGPGLICYKDGNINYVTYSEGGLLIYDFKEERGELFSEDPFLLYEKTKLTILSRVGELLDQRGLHRIHAVAVARHDKALICLMPMEGGKTTTALNLLKKDPEIKILADDVCLIDRHGCIFPFMLRVGARDRDLIENIPSEFVMTIDRPKHGVKYFVDPAFFKDRLGEKMRLTHILIGQRAFRPGTEIRPLGKIKCFMPMIESGVFGLGLPQLLEFFVRGDFKMMAGRIGVILKRVFFCASLIGKAKTFTITIGRDKNASSEQILRLLKAAEVPHAA